MLSWTMRALLISLFVIFDIFSVVSLEMWNWQMREGYMQEKKLKRKKQILE